MTQSSYSQFVATTPAPKAIRWLTRGVIGLSLLVLLLTRYFPHFLPYTGVELTALSPWAITKGFIWQPFTYFLAVPFTSMKDFILSLVFDLMLFRWIGGTVAQRLGTGPFLRSFFLSGIVGGIVGSLFMLVFPATQPVAGIGLALYPLFLAWLMVVPAARMLRWIGILLLGVHVLVDGSNGDYALVATYLTSTVTMYVYALSAWNLRSPFPQTHRFDDLVARLGVAIRRRWGAYRQRRQEKQGKVFDFKTGRPVRSSEAILEINQD